MNKTFESRLHYAYLPVFSFLLFIALEIQNNMSGTRNVAVFAISCVVLFMMLMLLFAVTHNVFASGIIVTAVLLTFYSVSFYKRMMTGVVLIPPDINLIRSFGGLSAFIDLSFQWRPIASILCAAALNLPLYFASKHIRLELKSRAATYITSGLLMFALLFTRFSLDTLMPFMNISASADMSYNDIYEEKGALLGFFTVAIGWEVEPPEHYEQASMEAISALVIADTIASASADADYAPIKPNVIVVMCESLWDPTRLPNVTFSEDPMPNYRRLLDVATTGNVVSPVFGGMTSNVEYEFLTGNAMHFVRFGDIPYYDSEIYIYRDNGRSLPSMFKANGYRTVGLHSYSGIFYDRDKHYPKLGFDAYIAQEDMPNARFKGTAGGRDIVSDEYFGDKLIEILDDSDDPLFLFGVTVQNHMPYVPVRYEGEALRGITADCGGILSEEDAEYLEVFLEGTFDADALLGRLYDHVMQFDEPTMLLYFGDHLPAITRHTELYTELGYISGNELNDLPIEDVYRMLATPYIAFSNYSELPSTWGDMSTYYLGALLAEAAGIELNYYYHFLLQTFESYQVLNNYIYIGNGVASAETPAGNEAIQMFEAFQFDKLFGDAYASEIMKSFPLPDNTKLTH